MKRFVSQFGWACAGILAVTMAARATIVVDINGSGQYTSLQAAVDAALPGEQILVKAGTYGTATDILLIDGKGLAICAEAGAVVNVPALRILSLPAGHWVVVRGLTLGSTEPQPYGALGVEDSEGTVWAEDCTLTNAKEYIVGGGFFPLIHAGDAGAVIENGGSLTLQRCTVKGSDGHDKFQVFPDKIVAGKGDPAVRVHDAQVVVQDCTLQGGAGGNGEIPFFTGIESGWGGAGLSILGNSFAHVSGSTVTGGSNGSNTLTDDVAGYGLYGEGPAKAWVKDSVFLPGPLVGTGVPAEPIGSWFLPAVTSFPEPSRSIVMPSPLREGQAGSLEIQGQQGDVLMAVITLGPGFQPLKGKHGVLVVDPSLLFLPVPLGVISSPSGAASIPFVMPSLNPALDGLTIPLQLVVVAGGQATLEAATAVAWLDAGI